MDTNKIYNETCLETVKRMPDEFIDCVVTSPPYYGLRDYGTGRWEGGDPDCDHVRSNKKSDKTTTGHRNFDDMGGVGDAIFKSKCAKCGAKRIDEQIGLEETPEEYVQSLVTLFAEIRRALKKSGTVWLNLGDSYATSHPHGTKDDDTGWAHGNISQGYMARAGGVGGQVKQKDLIGIPWRVALALQADGWYLRQDIIWHKPNPMPESVKDRCTKSHEYIFLLTKAPRYYFDSKAIEEEATGFDGRKKTMHAGSEKYLASVVPGQAAHTFAAGQHERWRYDENNMPVRNKRSVWTVATKPFADAHFAVYPTELISPCIQAGCPEDGIVYDPFMGSGTTAEVAHRLGRNWIGSELNPDYVKIAMNRLKPFLDQTDLFRETS